MKILKFSALFLLIAGLVYLAGPTMPTPSLDKKLPVIDGSVENFIRTKESNEKVRPGCDAKFLWANDSTKEVTEYVLLYLHGFSAARREGYPVNEDFARHFGCNAFLARLASHGVVTENPMLDMTPDRLYESAKEALVVAGKLGKKVIIMGCSTGCTLALMLAADFPDRVHALILYSPNIQIKNKTAVLLSKPWGLQIARLNYGSNFRVTDDDPKGEVCKYWYCLYRAEATVYLQQLLDASMKKETFEKVNCPVFMGYYYKDEQNQDQVVEVKAAIKMFGQLGTTANQKRSVAFPTAGAHVISSDLFSGAVNEVRAETFTFAEKMLGMIPVSR